MDHQQHKQCEEPTTPPSTQQKSPPLPSTLQNDNTNMQPTNSNTNNMTNQQ
jgi:hypothetical protein